MTDLSELYQEVILDHNRQPRNYHELPRADRRAEGHNPLCGDRLKLFVVLEGDVLRDIGFIGSGCAISKASASMMTEALKGTTRAQAEGMFRAFHALVTGQEAPDGGAGARDAPGVDLGKLVVFSGVCHFPVRVKCATLAWHTLRAALDNRADTATTE